jgi:integrase
MARVSLTDSRIRALKPAPSDQRYEVLDAIVPGLIVRVTDTGRRTLMLKTRFPGSRHPTRRAIGEYGAITLDLAREKARAWHELIRRGIDPADEEARVLREQERTRVNTFAKVAEGYIARQVVGRDYDRLIAKAEELVQDSSGKMRRFQALAKVIQDPANEAKPLQRKAAVVIRELDREFIIAWGDWPITDISAHDVVMVIDAAVQRGAEYQAHNLLGHVRRLFNWAIGRNIYGLDRSPCDRMRPQDVIGKKALRTRVLDDVELGALWRAAAKLGYPDGPFYRMLLLTGQRKSEVAGARWSEFNLDKALWIIPAARMKMDAPHVVPLVPEVVALVKKLPRFKRGNQLFTTTFGEKPINGFSKSKARLDARMARSLRAFARYNGEDDPRAIALRQFVIHDIRRTVRTHLSALPVPDLVRELVIAHTKTGLHKVYDQYAYLNEKRQALELWTARLYSIVEPTLSNNNDNVVRLIVEGGSEKREVFKHGRRDEDQAES